LRPVRAAGRDDERADEVAASLEIADPDHGRGGDRTVSREHALDLERSEGPAARRDDVLRAADEREESLLVHVRDGAGQVPVAEVGGLRLLGLLPVAGEERGRPPADREVALDARRELVALVVDDPDVVPGQGTSERSRLRLAVGET